MDVLGQGVVQPQHGGEGGGVGGVLVERGEGPVAPGAQGVGGEGVGGDVHGVDGLAGTGVPGVPALEFGVDRREEGSDLLGDGLRETRRHPLLPALAHATSSRSSALRIQQFVEMTLAGDPSPVNTVPWSGPHALWSCSHLSGTVCPCRLTAVSHAVRC